MLSRSYFPLFLIDLYKEHVVSYYRMHDQHLDSELVRFFLRSLIPRSEISLISSKVNRTELPFSVS
jgi:hypothetical protein